MEIQDFSNRKNFPGETGNEFDVVLHRYDSIEKTPSIIFACLLYLLALLPAGFDFVRAIWIWSFFLLDWLLLAALPKAGRSFGPAKPPVALLAILRSLFAWLPFPFNLAFQIIGTALVIYGFWIEPLTLKVTRQKLVSTKLKPGSKFTLLHLGDLHIERITARERALTEQIAVLKPDLILFSGDVLNLSYNQDAQAIADARQVMSAWQAPYGVYAVPGSPAVDLEDFLSSIYHDLDIKLLKHERTTITAGENKVDLIGLTCSHRPFVDGPILEKLAASAEDAFTILLYHTPDLAPNAQKMPIDLQLSGHTHGGQVQIPGFGALFTASLYGRAFSNGRYQLNDLTLYITRGIGMEGAGAPRVRFFCPPEIILWEIYGPD